MQANKIILFKNKKKRNDPLDYKNYQQLASICKSHSTYISNFPFTVSYNESPGWIYMNELAEGVGPNNRIGRLITIRRIELLISMFQFFGNDIWTEGRARIIVAVIKDSTGAVTPFDNHGLLQSNPNPEDESPYFTIDNQYNINMFHKFKVLRDYTLAFTSETESGAWSQTICIDCNIDATYLNSSSDPNALGMNSVAFAILAENKTDTTQVAPVFNFWCNYRILFIDR